MTFKEKVSRSLEEALLEKPSLFLIDLSINDSFKITVTLDGDSGVALQDCIDISRFIENNLDREECDFSLEVASAGVSSPLKNRRQYKKNIGRTLLVETLTSTIEAKLTEANDDFIVVEWEAREPKKNWKRERNCSKKRTNPLFRNKKSNSYNNFLIDRAWKI